MGFKKGKSGNPKGRPKIAEDFIKLAQDHAPEAFQRILEIAQMNTPDIKTKLRANEVIVDRAYGRAAQAVALTDAKGGNLPITILIGNKEIK